LSERLSGITMLYYC